MSKIHFGSLTVDIPAAVGLAKCNKLPAATVYICCEISHKKKRIGRWIQVYPNSLAVSSKCRTHSTFQSPISVEPCLSLGLLPHGCRLAAWGWRCHWLSPQGGRRQAEKMLSAITEEGFPGGASGIEPACQSRRPQCHWFSPWVEKIPWRRACNPLRHSCLESPTSIGAWWPAVHRVAESETRLKWLSTHTHHRGKAFSEALQWTSVLNLFDQNWVTWPTTRETGKVYTRKEHARGKVGVGLFSPGTGVECWPIVISNYWGSASKEDSGGGRGSWQQGLSFAQCDPG